MTEVKEITVQFVNSPRPGRKLGSVKAAEGMTFYCQPAMLKEFSVGEVCRVEYTSKIAPPTADFPNATEFHTLTRKLWTGDGKHMAPGHVSVPPPIIHTKQATNPKDSENMLVSVLLKEPRFDDWPTSQIVQLILKHREAARLSVNPQRADDMNDEIPNWEPIKSENPED